MKKIIVLMLVLTVAGASSAFATDVSYAESPTIGTLSVKTSKNVSLGYKSATDNTGYTACTYHNKGTKTYGSSSGDAKVYEAATTGATVPSAPTGTASANFASGTWTAL